MNRRSLYILCCFLVLSISASIGQSKLETISFRSRNTNVSPIVETAVKIENNGIDVRVYVFSKLIDADTLNNKVTIDTNYVIKTQSFEKFVDAVLSLKSDTFLENLKFKGLGGCQTEIEFGNQFNSIVYRVWSPNVETKKRELDPYIAVCKLIVKAGKLNFKDLL